MAASTITFNYRYTSSISQQLSAVTVALRLRFTSTRPGRGCRYVADSLISRDNREGTRRCARGRTRRKSRARSEAKRRRCETLTEPLARQWGLLRTVCSVSPCCSHPLDRPSRSLTHLPSSSTSEHPSSFLLFLSPLRARVLSYLVARPRGAYNPTLRYPTSSEPGCNSVHTQRRQAPSALRDPTILRSNS